MIDAGAPIIGHWTLIIDHWTLIIRGRSPRPMIVLQDSVVVLREIGCLAETRPCKTAAWRAMVSRTG